MNSTTLVIIDTDSYELANNAILNSINNFDFQEIIIFTDNKKSFNNGKIIEISKISNMRQYNEIILKILPNYIKTDFALIIQYDGYILNGSTFNPEIYNYDYTGAAWNTQNYGLIIGNGGFSMRSKRLLNLCLEYNKFDFDTAEDISICWSHRQIFEHAGIKFCPVDLANHFSREHVTFPNTFGFHGIFHLPIIFRNELSYLIDNLPKRIINNRKNLCEVIKNLSMIDEIAAIDFTKELINSKLY